jgi:shikimate dehydrogenase
MPSIPRYGVMGNPIAHSLSPTIHRAFAEQTGQTLTSERIQVAPENFETAVREFFANGGLGLKITLPLKELAWRIADERGSRALLAGAVNTLCLQNNGSLFGENHDGVGLVRDVLQNQHWPLRDKRVLILGAGGAVRGVLGPLLAEQPREIVIANRTLEKAQRLVEIFSHLGHVRACDYAALSGQSFDFVINGTSADVLKQTLILPDGLLAPGAKCYDMMYRLDGPTSFLQWAMSQGALNYADGLGMLVEENAEAFFLWRGVRPETTSVLKQLRQST